ncbi:P-loop containing nucleoside triphosphate hydrolase protein [Rhizophagus clarus]|uniref:P-loop containing nucleoside triphosphate hydrolase protein n=1 Tax=Rhizophagus clarus TaxID=94130 RepID=A0A8H3KYG2_9GLOM|nr:P-loop containing nucleoside triphosphate hydrolase protein [Rhizophagus clarus]
MSERKGKKSGFNNDDTQKSTGGGRPRSNRGRHDGGNDDGHRRDGRRDIIDKSRNHVPTPPKLSVSEIKQSQRETTIMNFNSSELTYNGSDRLIFITNGEPIKTIWKRILKKDKPWNQNDVRIFVSSTLVATDHRTGYEVDEIVTELGNPECGLKRLKEIINFPSISCDAGLDSDVLSFQYVVLPLLGLFTRTAITECTLEKYVHAIFSAVYVSLDSFLYDKVMKMLETLVQRNSVEDNRVSAEALLSRARYSFIPSSLGVFFLIIVRLLTELLRRIKEASVNETMHNIANDLYRLKTEYQQSIETQQISSSDPLTSNLESRNFFFTILEREMKTMDKMLHNGRKSLIFEQNPEAKNLNVKLDQLYYKELARRVDAKRTYDPPGELSKYGKRHDNDFVEISEISIIPTNEEILCERPPFLPSSLRDSLHFLPDGAARLLDTQFRLLREDLLNPIRGGLSNLLTALSQEYTSSNSDVKLSKELKKIQDEGGRFSYNNGMNENGDLQVYTNIQFANISCDKRKGFACTIRFTPPRINAKDEKGRKEYWEKSKRLLTGSLVTLILPNPNPKEVNLNTTTTNNSGLYSLYFGVVVSRDEKALSKDEFFAEIDINFIDPSIYPIALSEISSFKKRTLGKRFMVESTGVYLEAYYHILKTLQTTNPSSLPFEKYLAPNFDDMNNDDDENEKMEEGTNSTLDIEVESPLYTRAPGFQFDLSILCKNKHKLRLDVADESTHDRVIKNIVKYSNIGKSPDGTTYGLDETQTKALISSLTREIALVEGPPGTGKTVVGVQIMKVLLANENQKTKIGPILTICFTNHALDQFLEHLLDENITKIVRLGSRTKSERIKEYNLEEICRNRPRNKKQSYLLALLYQSIETIEKDTQKLKNTLFNRWMKWSDISDYLMHEEVRFFSKFNTVSEKDLPGWVLGTDVEEGFQTARKNNKQSKKDPFDEWIRGGDIRIINKRKKFLLNPSKSDKKNKKKPNQNIFGILTTEDYDVDISDNESQVDYYTIEWIKNYEEPKSDRPLEELLNDYSVWKMSMVERERLHDHWRTKIYKKIVEKLSKLQKRYEENRKEIDNIHDEGRRQVLRSCDVIGMTTNGAAKFQNLIKSIGPKIIVCEEAGEVLEAHILSTLTSSTQHLILIGDHNQLRPHIATYSLSMDSSIGKNYQLDKSLFERLVNGDKAVKIEKAQLLTQRRMRGEISDLIRYTIYPDLIDGENTTKYENIRGAQHNVYFIDHRNPEDNSGGEFAVKSHVNRYEVRMVVEMVKYFVRNGYTKSDDIAVLTPYLGQMIKIRDALSKLFAVIIDERDALDITEMEEQHQQSGINSSNIETISVASKKSLNRQVTLRTVDNFQGEEANIVIVSLVRNFSKSDNISTHDSIGFLNSKNRTNVLLSRARKGMYLIGNSELMAMKSKEMWAPAIKILRERNQVDFGMPIVCNKHPHYKNIIVDPDQFEKISPNGGCHENCNISLRCGHVCKNKCHSDDPEHIGVKCNASHCLRLHSGCNHPCQRRCSDDCGICEFPVGNILLPGCGHILQNANCLQNRNKGSIKCKTLVSKKLLHCEHYKDIRCSKSVNKVNCTELCGKLLECGHECPDLCFECYERSKSQKHKNKNTSIIANFFNSIEQTTHHGECQNVCGKLLPCEHACKSICHGRSKCPPCDVSDDCARKNNTCTIN